MQTKKQPVRLCCVDTTVTVSTVLMRRWNDGKMRGSLPAADLLWSRRSSSGKPLQRGDMSVMNRKLAVLFHSVILLVAVLCSKGEGKIDLMTINASANPCTNNSGMTWTVNTYQGLLQSFGNHGDQCLAWPWGYDVQYLYLKSLILLFFPDIYLCEDSRMTNLWQ